MNQTQTKSLRQKLKPLLPFAALLLLLVTLLMLLTDTTSMPTQEVHSENGIWDLRDFDFENYNALLTGDVAYVPHALLNPIEFSSRNQEIYLGNTSGYDFVTSRVIILLPSDGWYTFMHPSNLHAHRQYVNGMWLSDVGRGRPGYSRETEIPDTGRVIFTAHPQDGTMELVQQSSNFVHARGSHHMGWLVGAGTGIIYETRADDFRQGIVMGSFFLLFLLFLLLYFMMGRNPATLYFSLFSLMWFIRVGITGARSFTVLMPWMHWVVKFRLQYIALPVAAILTIAIINVLFQNILGKIPSRIIYVGSTVFIVIYLFADTVFMSNALLVSYVFLGLGILYILLCFVLKVRNVNIEQGIFIGGMVLFMLATVSDFAHFTFNFTIAPFEATGMGMLVFALCAATSVFIATMKEVEKAKENEKLLATENAALDSLNRMKAQYLANMSHNIKTPLTAISVDIQKAARLVNNIKIENGELVIDERIAASLSRAQEEIMHAARLTESALRMAAMQESRDKMKPLDVYQLFVNNAEAYRSHVEKQGNVLKIDTDKNLPQIFGNADELMGVLTNLLTNANRHTKNGEIKVQITNHIEITAETQTDDDFDEPYIAVTVKDNGTGIPSELLPYVFERGVTGANSTGMGLAISKKTIETHGGEISVKSESGMGTEVTFTIPIYNNEERQEDGDV